jgi:hypothetical protein
MDVELKLPWSNFPGFKARKAGDVIALDAELWLQRRRAACVPLGLSSAAPLSVQQPANLGKIQLMTKT